MNPLTSPLLTDLYQLTMLQAYYEQGMTDTAVFELFVRKLPPGRRFLVAAGLEQALEFLAGARFGEEELDWIGRSTLFRPDFARRLAQWRFTGDVDAMPEGTPFFPDEPIVRVVAPMPEAQLVETRLLNLVHFQTVIASKATTSARPLSSSRVSSASSRANAVLSWRIAIRFLPSSTVRKPAAVRAWTSLVGVIKLMVL